MKTIGNLIQSQRELRPSNNGLTVVIDDKDKEMWLRWWPSPEDFMEWAKPASSARILQEPHKAWSNNYPTMAQLTALYGLETTKKWFKKLASMYLINSPKVEKLTKEQLDMIEIDLMSCMIGYTISEITLFFGMLRTGVWTGYNKGNPQEICQKFRHEFMEYRNTMIDKRDSERLMKRKEQELSRCVSLQTAFEMAKRGEIPPLSHLEILDNITKRRQALKDGDKR